MGLICLTFSSLLGARAQVGTWVDGKCWYQQVTGKTDLDPEESGEGVPMEACSAVCLARYSCAGATWKQTGSKCELWLAGGSFYNCATNSGNYGYQKDWNALPIKEATFADADLDTGELGGNLEWSIDNLRGDFQTHFLLYIAVWTPEPGPYGWGCPSNSQCTSPIKMWGAPRPKLNRMQLCLVGENSTDPPYPSWIIDGNNPGIRDPGEICAFPADQDGNFTYSAHIAPEVVHNEWTHFLVYPVILNKFWTDPIHVQIVDLTVTIGFLSFNDISLDCGFIGGQLDFSSTTEASQDGYDLFLSDSEHLGQGAQVLLRSVLKSEAPPLVFEPTPINGSKHGLPYTEQFTHLIVAARSRSAAQTKNYGSIRINDQGLTPRVENVIMPDADQFQDKVGGCVQWDAKMVIAMCVDEHVVIFLNSAGKTVITLPPVPVGETSASLALQTPLSSVAKIIVQSSLTTYGRNSSTWPIKVKELAAPLMECVVSETLTLVQRLETCKWPSNTFLDVSLTWNWTTQATIAYNFAPLESTPTTEKAFEMAFNQDKSLTATGLKKVFGELCLGGTEILMRTILMKHFPVLVRSGCGIARKLIKPPMCWTHRHGLVPGGQDFIVDCTIKMDIPAPHYCRQCSLLWKGIKNGTLGTAYVLERSMCANYRAVPW